MTGKVMAEALLKRSSTCKIGDRTQVIVTGYDDCQAATVEVNQ
jgi:hypothetical protein